MARFVLAVVMLLTAALPCSAGNVRFSLPATRQTSVSSLVTRVPLNPLPLTGGVMMPPGSLAGLNTQIPSVVPTAAAVPEGLQSGPESDAASSGLTDAPSADLASEEAVQAGLERWDGGGVKQRLEELPLSERTPAGLARALLAESDVLLIGENHLSLATHEIIRQMLLAPPPGLKLVSFEGPRRKPGDEAFMGDSIGADSGGSGAARGARYREIIREAQAVQLPILNIDVSFRTIFSQLGRRLKTSAQEASALFVSAMERRIELSGLTDAAFLEVLLDYRNRFMARVLARQLGAGGKAIVLVGEAHIEHGRAPPQLNPSRTTLASELAARGLRPFSLSVIGGPMAAGHEDDVVRKPLYAEFDATAPPGSMRLTSQRTAILYLGPIDDAR